MALILGTNCGFVTVAPTADPTGSITLSVDNQAAALKDTSPATAAKITEIGWWDATAGTQEANFEVGIYDHNVGDDNPENLLSGESRTNAKGTSGGWHVVTGLDITISASTIYWIGLQLDDTSTSTTSDVSGSGKGDVLDRKGTQTTLTDPWGTTGSNFDRLLAIYAVWEAVEPAGVTRKIKISGTFQDKPIKTKVAGTFVDKVVKIKVGGVFQ